MFGGNMNDMMSQIQKMQQEMARIQKEIMQKIIEVKTNNDAVVVTINGNQQILGIKLNPAILKEELEFIEDLLVAAVNEALKKSRETAAQELQKITDQMGLNLPNINEFLGGGGGF